MQRKWWRGVVAVVLLLGLSACGRSATREIGAGYRLKRADGEGHFVLLAPNDSGGLIIDEIGWRKPFIMARAAGSRYWDAIDTAHAEHVRISDEKRRSDPAYQVVRVESARLGWENLKPSERLW